MATTPTKTEMEPPPPGRFIALSVHAREVFANHEKALGWLQTPNSSLAGRTPLEAAATEESAAAGGVPEIPKSVKPPSLDRRQ